MRKISEDITAAQLWNVYGSFGYVNSPVRKEASKVSVSNEEYEISSEYVEDENGVTLRTGKIKNISGHNIEVNCLMSKFVFDGGEYEVYTQANTWQNESLGSWQPVITAVSAESRGVRNAYGAAPFVAIWNNQTGRGTAFHIITRLAWRFEVANVPEVGEANRLEVEIGLNNANFIASLAHGEELELPEILFYEFRNKRDLDCYKLHCYFNKKYPRREMPVIYNTWLYKFEKIDFENVAAQVKTAKDLGVEYFVIDAAWYGHGDFWDCRGDWFENREEAFRGRMSELSEMVREAGMKFGFWLEVETGGPNSVMRKTYKDYYFTYHMNGDELYFFDFSNPQACEYMFKTVSGLVERYHAGFIKFDFNQDLKLDIHQHAFKDYFKGYDDFIKKIRNRYPDLYLENCASGGLRMNLANGMDFDSFWLSDNQSPYEGMRIFKDTIRRMPPQMIEKWAVVQSVCDFKHCYGEAMNEKIISTNDATWTDVRGVNQSYLEGFLTGSPIGLSCDLNSLSDSVCAGLKKFIERFKKDRNFWKKAVCRILADTEAVLVLEYSDMDFEKSEILVYTNRIRQTNIVIYPKLNCKANYRINGENVVSGIEIDKDGIDVKLDGNYSVKRVTVERI